MMYSLCDAYVVANELKYQLCKAEENWRKFRQIFCILSFRHSNGISNEVKGRIHYPIIYPLLAQNFNSHGTHVKSDHNYSAVRQSVKVLN